jgi:hemolysin activation/secretion protein
METFLIKRTQIFGAGLALCLAHLPVMAADPPDAGAIYRLEREQLERLLQEQRLQKKPVQPEVAVPAAPASGSASQVRNIPVKSFQVDDSAILSKEEISDALAPYEGKTASLADLMEAVAAINALYAGKSMPTARAFLPPQDIKDGVVRIRLVEARVGEIRMGAMTQVTPEFVRERMSLDSGELMSVPVLENDLIRFNRLHDVQLRAGVQAGKSVGTTDLQLEAVEPKRYQYSLFADNAGRYTVGEYRFGFTARALGLAGRGDSLLFTAVAGEGNNSYYLGYSTPINARDLKLDVSYSRGSIKVVNGNFVPLDVSGQSRDFTVGLSLPAVVESQRLRNYYGRLSIKESVNETGGVANQNLDLAVLSLGVSGEHQRDTSAWTYDVNINQGLQDFGGEASYTAIRANGAWMGRSGERSQIILRGNLQFSPTELLPAAEQFQLGGSASVRGYSEGLLSGRNGYLVSAEWRYALDRAEGSVPDDPSAPQFTTLLFLDHGGAFPYRPSPLKDATSQDYLTGAGFGLQADWRNRMTARAALAWPLRSNDSEVLRREPHVHASISINW